MANPRATRSGRGGSRASARPGSRIPRQAQQASSTQPMMIVGIGVAVVAVIAVFSMVGSGDDNATAPKTPPAKTVTEKPAVKTVAPVPKAADQAGKTPTKPAPPIDAATLAKATEHYEVAKNAYNDCRKAKNVGKHEEAKMAARLGWSELEKAKALIQPWLDWDEEAEFEGWAKPGEYVSFINGFYSKKYVKMLKNLRKQVR